MKLWITLFECRMKRKTTLLSWTKFQFRFYELCFHWVQRVTRFSTLLASKESLQKDVLYANFTIHIHIFIALHTFIFPLIRLLFYECESLDNANVRANELLLKKRNKKQNMCVKYGNVCATGNRLSNSTDRMCEFPEGCHFMVFIKVTINRSKIDANFALFPLTLLNSQSTITVYLQWNKNTKLEKNARRRKNYVKQTTVDNW